MDWQIVITGHGQSDSILEGDAYLGSEALRAQDSDLAVAARALIDTLRHDGHDIQSASFASGSIKGGSINLLLSPLVETIPEPPAPTPTETTDVT